MFGPRVGLSRMCKLGAPSLYQGGRISWPGGLVRCVLWSRVNLTLILISPSVFTSCSPSSPWKAASHTSLLWRGWTPSLCKLLPAVPSSKTPRRSQCTVTSAFYNHISEGHLEVQNRQSLLNQNELCELPSAWRNLWRQTVNRVAQMCHDDKIQKWIGWGSEPAL